MFKQQGGFWLYFVGIIIMFLLLFFVAELVMGKTILGFGGGSSQNTTSTNVTSTPVPVGSGASVSATGLDSTKDYYAEISTSQGTIKVDLFEKNAPNTVANFIDLANSGYYNNTKFYKLLQGAYVQGGSKDDTPTGGPGYTIPDETNWDSLDYSDGLRAVLRLAGYTSAKIVASVDIDKYDIVMANPTPNSAGSQFMILLSGKENSTVLNLRGRVTVFGKVIEDFSTIQGIASVQVDNSGSFPKPRNDILVSGIKIFIK